MAKLNGTASSQIPINSDLGRMAFQDPSAVVIEPQAVCSPLRLGDMVFQLTNNTTLVIKVRGTDSVVRSVTLTLA